MRLYHGSTIDIAAIANLINTMGLEEPNVLLSEELPF